MIAFDFKNYRRAFAKLFADQRARRPGWSSAQLAEKTRLQPSYLTNVIKERAHFSSDQIYTISEALGLSNEETIYLNLLMELERADHPGRKKSLAAQVEKLRQKNLNAAEILEAKPSALSEEQKAKYYLDPNIELVHLYLGLKKAAVETSDVAKVWGFSVNYAAEILLFLEKATLIERKKNHWAVNKIHQLLPRTSPLCQAQQMLKRLRAMEAQQKMPAEKTYSFSAAITMTEETRTEIQARFLEFLKECEKLVLQSEREGLYHLQFDLFPWLDT